MLVTTVRPKAEDRGYGWNLRFGSLADKRPPAKTQRCPPLPESFIGSLVVQLSMSAKCQ